MAATNGQTNGHSWPARSRLVHAESSVNIEDFKKICARTTDPNTYPLAFEIQENIPIYDTSTFNPLNPSETTALKDEWYDILESGPGIFVLKGMYDPSRYNTTRPAVKTTVSGTRSPNTPSPIRPPSQITTPTRGSRLLARPGSALHTALLPR